MGPRSSRRIANALVVLTAAMFAAAVVVTIVRIAQLEPKLRTVRFPGIVARAVILLCFVVLPLAGLATHRALFLSSTLLMLAFLAGDYASEDVLAPIAGLTVAVFVAAYVKRSEQTRFPGKARTGLLIASTLLGTAALAAVHLNPRILIWDRTKQAGRTVSVFTATFDGTCGTRPTYEVQSKDVDGGCDLYVPHTPARVSVALMGLCMITAVAAVARAPARARLKSER